MSLNVKKQAKLLETVYLYDKENEKNYTVIISTEDAEKCNEDAEYASYILQLAKDSQSGQAVDNQTSQNELQEESKDDTLWSYKETMALLSCYEEHNERFKHSRNKRIVWETISNELQKLGYDKYPRKCEIKWRNLVRTYKIIKASKNNRSSRFQFFEKLEEIMSNQSMHFRTNNPNKSTGSIEIDCAQPVTVTQGNGVKWTPNVTHNTKKNDNYDIQQSDCNEEDIDTPAQKKMKRNAAELIKLKINYFKQKEDARAAKERRKEEKLALQKRLLQIEEKKILLLEKYLNKTLDA